MPVRNPAAFAVAGSAPIHELVPVNEPAESEIVRPPDEGRNKSDGGSVIRTISPRVGYWIAGKKTNFLKRYGYRPR
jgi:hypothetical protein